jgi:hypothetical protein
MSNLIRCVSHGNQTPVMACTHIRTSSPAELYVVPADDEFPRQAWCQTCEEARLKDQGWFDYADSVASWAWLCDSCLSDAIARASHTTHVANPEVTPDDQSD